MAEQVKKQKNGFALAGFLLGIVAMFLAPLGLFPILAIVFSWVGLSKADDFDGAGKVTGWIGLTLGILYTILFFSRLGGM